MHCQKLHSIEKQTTSLAKDTKETKTNGCPDVQALIRSLNIVHEKDALFFLPVQLLPALEEHYEKNGAIALIGKVLS